MGLEMSWSAELTRMAGSEPAGLVAQGRGSSSLRNTPGYDARHKPGAPINHFQHFTGVHDFKRLHQRNEFTVPEQVIVGGGSGFQRSLLFEERFRHQIAASPGCLEKDGHPLPVQVVEDHDDIERPARGRLALQVGVAPLDETAVFAACFLGFPQRVQVRVNRNNLRPALGSRARVTSAATGYVEHESPFAKQPAMPHEPGAHTLEL